MPDLLTHYALSYLIASRAVKPKYATFIALIGVLPDVDALLRVHRWVTHSLTLTLLTALVVAMATLYAARKLLKYLALGLLLYTLHIILDVFTAPTPLMWPITDRAYTINVELTGVVTGEGIGLAPNISTSSETANLTPQPTVHGPIVSTYGVIVATSIVIAFVVERFFRRK